VIVSDVLGILTFHALVLRGTGHDRRVLLDCAAQSVAERSNPGPHDLHVLLE
jgi:hypothetical protein